MIAAGVSGATDEGGSMGVVHGIGRLVGKGAQLVAPAVASQVGKVIRTVGPSPQELVGAAEKAADKLRSSHPELMAKVSSAATSVADKAGEYLPGVVERARSMVDAAHAQQTQVTQSKTAAPAKEAGVNNHANGSTEVHP